MAIDVVVKVMVIDVVVKVMVIDVVVKVMVIDVVMKREDPVCYQCLVTALEPEWDQ